jgi:hypothetical protein
MELRCHYLTRRMSHTEIGQRLGGISASALSKNKKRLEAKMRGDAALPRSFYKVTALNAT